MSGLLPIRAFLVMAYAEPFDETPEAVFEVNATDQDDALMHVGQHPSAKYYRKLSAKLDDRPGPLDRAGVISFSKVEKR